MSSAELLSHIGCANLLTPESKMSMVARATIIVTLPFCIVKSMHKLHIVLLMTTTFIDKAIFYFILKKLVGRWTLISILFYKTTNVSVIVYFQVRNGHIKRITDNDIQSLVLEIVGTNVRYVYIF